MVFVHYNDRWSKYFHMVGPGTQFLTISWFNISNFYLYMAARSLYSKNVQSMFSIFFYLICHVTIFIIEVIIFRCFILLYAQVLKLLCYVINTFSVLSHYLSQINPRPHKGIHNWQVNIDIPNSSKPVYMKCCFINISKYVTWYDTFGNTNTLIKTRLVYNL